MRSTWKKRLIASVMTMAMVVTGANLSPAASAAPKASVKLSKTSASLNVGKSVTLKVKTKNVKKVVAKKWTTSKKSVATVSKSGKVVAKKAGQAIIKCKVTYKAKGSSKTLSKTLKCMVKVTTVTTNATPVPTPAPTPVPDPSKVVVTGDVTSSNTNLKMVHDDCTNIDKDATPVTTTVPGGTIEIIKKDNGKMRTDITAQQLASTAMGTGVNLGNTFESVLDSTTGHGKYDVIKGNDELKYGIGWVGLGPYVTQEYFDMLHSYGINTVRIPVAWSEGDSDDGTHKLDEKLLARIEEVVNYALNNGMYVIVNDHWDNQWWGGFGACKKDENNKKVADEARRADAWARYEAYWTQIAERFKDYSDHLMFAGANEELGDRLNDSIYPSTGYCWTMDKNEKMVSGNLKKDEKYETTNKINQLFVDIFRKSGGNNKNRFLVIPGYNTNFDDTADSRFIMPTDIEENGKNRLFTEVHYYTPWDFCGDGGTGIYSLQAQKDHAGYFAVMQRFVDEGYATILGECGVCAPLSVTGSVTKWFEDVFTQCRQYYAVPCLWETGQYFDRKANKLYFYDVANFFNAVNDANGDNTMSKHTGATTGDSPYVVSVKDKKPVWSWTGKWYKNGGDYIVGDDRFETGGGTDVSNEEDKLSFFVPESKVNATIAGDNTEIVFDPAGFQAYLKLDLSKYKKPAIKFTFSDSSLENFEDDENYVGRLQLGATDAAYTFKESVGLAYDKFSDRGVLLQDELQLSEANPYLSIAFSNKPTITAIEIYEMGE